jgi:hypothetical protein
LSAIFGYVALDGRPVTADVLRRPMDAAVDYGTDAVGTWTGDAVALGHRARHFTPESLGETLPFESEGLAITCDARIDNRDELIALHGADRAMPNLRTPWHRCALCRRPGFLLLCRGGYWHIGCWLRYRRRLRRILDPRNRME